MPFYLYQARLSPKALEHVLHNSTKFDEVMRQSVAAFGGELVKCFLTAAGGDPIGFLIFKNDIRARAWSLYYGGQDGVMSSKIRRLLETDELSEIDRIIHDSRDGAEAHRKGRGRD